MNSLFLKQSVKSEVSKVQQAVDEVATQASADKFQLNETKCKELRITFRHSRKNFDPIKFNGQDLEFLCDKLFNSILSNPSHELYTLLPPKNECEAFVMTSANG